MLCWRFQALYNIESHLPFYLYQYRTMRSVASCGKEERTKGRQANLGKSNRRPLWATSTTDPGTFLTNWTRSTIACRWSMCWTRCPPTYMWRSSIVILWTSLALGWMGLVGQTYRLNSDEPHSAATCTMSQSGSANTNTTASRLKSDTVAVLAVLPRYWGRNTRDSRADGDQSCGTIAAMGLSFSHVHVH